MKKVLTERDLGADKAAAVSKDIIDMMMATMRAVLRDHDLSMPSVHLLMISKLVGFCQMIDEPASAQFLDSLTAIARAGEDAAAMATAQFAYAAAHAKLLQAFDLYYSRPEDGGRA